MSLTVAVAQFATTEDKAANLAAIEGLLRQAADRGARLVVLPEYAVFTVPAMDDRFVESAEALDGPTVTRLAELAGEHGLARLSMGTTQDYVVAVEEGATIVRLGSVLYD